MAPDAATEAAPTCAEAAAACLDALRAQIRADCDEGRVSCVAQCNGNKTCENQCIARWTSCQVGYEHECVTCATQAGVCDPTAYCHQGVTY